MLAVRTTVCGSSRPSTAQTEPLESRLLFAGTGPSPGAVFTPLVSGDFNLDGTSDEVVFARANRARKILAASGADQVGRGLFVVDGGLATLGLLRRGPGGSMPLVSTGDFNNDGAPDIGVANRGRGGDLEVFLNDGSGGFGTGTTVATPAPVTSLAVADFNDDGNDDLLIGTNSRRLRNALAAVGPRDTIGSDAAGAAQMLQGKLEFLTGNFLPSTTGAGVSAEAGAGTGLPAGAFIGPADIAPGVTWVPGAITSPMTWFFAVGSGQGASFSNFLSLLMPGASEEAGGGVSPLVPSWDNVFPPDAGLAPSGGGSSGDAFVLLGNGDGTFQEATPIGGTGSSPFIPVFTPAQPAP